MTPYIHLNNWQKLQVESTGAKNGLCDCCGTQTQHDWGFVHFENSTIASYFVSWTVGRPDHGAWFDLLIGQWGGESDPSQRNHVALEFLLLNGNPNFMVRNSNEANRKFTSLAHYETLRDDIIGTTLAPHIFAITDALYMSEYLQEIRSWSS